MAWPDGVTIRRLLDTALQMRDSIRDVLNTLGSRYASERDLRVLARDVLAAHALVRSVHYHDDAVEFFLANGDSGRIDSDGQTFVGDKENRDEWHEHPPRPRERKNSASSGPNWDAPKGGDLDDEIPF